MKKGISEKDLRDIAASVGKTGFVLENNVTTTLRRHGWTVLNNRYYLDSDTESAREIDLIAYKSGKAGQLSHRDVLIISCKKSEENYWAFMVRDIYEKDPNIDWHPLCVWSNLGSVNFGIQSRGWKHSYLEHLKKEDLYGKVIAPTDHQFAFQEISKGQKALVGEKKNPKKSVQNDSNIFRAVSSLMKAQAYNVSALGNRKDPRTYNFSLISVADTELIRLHFAPDGKIDPKEVKEARFVVNYIVDKKETFARVHFVVANEFDACLSNYDRLFEVNNRYFGQLEATFYKDIFTDYSRVDVYLKEFSKLLGYSLSAEVENFKESQEISVSWSEAKEAVVIGLALPKSDIERLNNSKSVTAAAKRQLKQLYRYEGPFFFDYDIPF